MESTVGQSIVGYTAVVAVASSFALAGGAQAARDQINIVGSSTVFPFATAVAEKFGNKTKFKTPKIESTGSGGGLKLFCKGVGEVTPDITNASRRMKAKEWKKCQVAGVRDVIEFKIGFDGIVIGNAKSAVALNLTRAQIYMALHKGSKARLWSDVDPALPNTKIEVLGPPPTSGTRDAFEELVMQKGCAKAGAGDQKFCKKVEIRDDGAWVDSGENDNLVVSKLQANPNALGVFGFSFLDQNKSKIKGSKVGGTKPTFENIASGKYPVSRSLFFYVKKAHVGVIPGIKEYLAEWTANATFGGDGYLVDKGLIPLRAAGLKEAQAKAAELTVMTGLENLK
ncbi:MAG: phosphate transport system substrate-binding protein [Hyphomicrobiaceae bacterium]|jgi:phosphate transport system substrate-binding protein